MKQKTKKILIIALAVVAVAIIVWFVIHRSKLTLEGIVSKLNLNYSGGDTEDKVKQVLLAEAKAVKKQVSREEIESEAKKDGLTFNKEVVYYAAWRLYNDIGYFNETAAADVLKQLRNM